MAHRAHIIAFGVIAVITAVLLNLQPQTSGRAKLALSSLFLPLFGLAGSGQVLTERLGSGVTTRKALIAEIEELRLENQRLKIEAMQHAQIWRENVQLRSALQWRQQLPWKAKPARIMYRDPVNWFRTIQIDIGAQDGVVTNATVLTEQGLVGRVEDVGPSSSRVALIGDPLCKVAIIALETKDHGVITEATMDGLDESIVQVSYVHRHATIKPGHKVYTSGLGGIFPPGITVGSIVDTRSVGYGLYQEARVKLAANLRNLEYVWVLLP